MFNEFAKHGVFLEVELETDPKKAFAYLFRRLCKIGNLFYQSDRSSSSSSSSRSTSPTPSLQPNPSTSSPPTPTSAQLSNLLPKSKSAPFHRYVINFCIDHELVTLLQVYLDFYELITNPDDLKAFQLDLTKSWIQLFFDFRFHHQFFKTAITQAQSLFEVSIYLIPISFFSSIF